jgi:hypothetical protein
VILVFGFWFLVFGFCFGFWVLGFGFGFWLDFFWDCGFFFKASTPCGRGSLSLLVQRK